MELDASLRFRTRVRDLSEQICKEHEQEVLALKSNTDYVIAKLKQELSLLRQAIHTPSQVRPEWQDFGSYGSNFESTGSASHQTSLLHRGKIEALPRPVKVELSKDKQRQGLELNGSSMHSSTRVPMFLCASKVERDYDMPVLEPLPPDFGSSGVLPSSGNSHSLPVCHPSTNFASDHQQRQERKGSTLSVTFMDPSQCIADESCETSSDLGSSKNFEDEGSSRNSVADTGNRRHSRHHYRKSTLISIQTPTPIPSHLVNSFVSELKLSELREQVIRHDSFEIACGIAIICNGVYMAWELQRKAEIGSDEEESSIAGLSFCLVFLLELCLRMYFQRCSFLFGRDWKLNLLDTCVVICMVVDVVLRFFSSNANIHLDTISMVRLLRLLRIFRAIRLSEFMYGHRQGRLLVLTVLKVLKASLWNILTFIAMVYMVSLLLADAAISECTGDRPGLDQDMGSTLCKYFGSFSVAFMSIYKAMLGGIFWGTLLDALEVLGFPYTLVFVAFITFYMLVLGHVFTGVFVVEVHRMADKVKNEDFFVHNERTRAKFIACMMHVFKQLDINEDGVLSMDELKAAFSHKVVSAQLAILEVDTVQAEDLFELLDVDKSGQVSVQEFVLGCLRLQGKAKSIELEKVKSLIKDLFKELEDMKEHLELVGCLESSPKSIVRNCTKNSENLLSPSVIARSNSPVGRQISPCSGESSMNVHVKAPPLAKTQSADTFGLSMLHTFTTKSTSGGLRKTNSIVKTEMRAMVISELLDVYAYVASYCASEKWVDMSTGVELLPEEVNLYHFNYYVMSPQTAADAIVLVGLERRNYSENQVLKQINIDTGAILGEAVVVEDTGNDGNVQVRLVKGKISTGVEISSRNAVIWDSSGCNCGIPSQVVNDGSVSYKELVSNTPTRPDWFCCHWWGEPISDFVSCCREHARCRQKRNYWVCAYANRQHDLLADISDDPESSSFRRAMKLAEGVLLVLDVQAVPFQRIWCGYELFTTVSDPTKMLDIITQRSKPRLLTEKPIPGEAVFDWRLRATKFPLKMLGKGIRVKLEDGRATVEQDKVNILNSMGRSPSSGTVDENLIQTNVGIANGHIRSRMALAAWPQALMQGKVRNFDFEGSTVSLPEVLLSDDERTYVHLNLSCLDEVNDLEMTSLASGLPAKLASLSLSFDGCSKLTDAGVSALAERLAVLPLRELKLDFGSCKELTDKGVQSLVSQLPQSIVDINLSFAFCAKVTKVGMMSLSDSLPSGVTKLKLTFTGTQFNHVVESVTHLRRLCKGGSASSLGSRLSSLTSM